MTDAIATISAFERFGSILGLERMNELLERLDNPQKALKVIHVAGTNGKGSVCRFVYHSLMEAGYSVGIYSSPFLECFNERIEMDGAMISDEDLEKYTDIVTAAAKEMVEGGFDSPTEFEVVTAIAILYFKEKQCDYVILEVGLGGRGDSTNVIDLPLITAITSISFDHTDRLGETIEEIAEEKAGIIKADVPVITGTLDEAADEVISKVALEKKSPVINTDNFDYEIISQTLENTSFKAKILNEEYLVKIPLLGTHQVGNGIIALTILEYLRANDIVKITKKDILKGFENTKHKGRFEIISKNPTIILDGGHNLAGSLTVAKTCNKLLRDKKLLQVVGILKDKDVNGIVENLLKVGRDFIVTEIDNPRTMTGPELKEAVDSLGGNSFVASDPIEAVKLAISKTDEYDGIVISGSLYLIGQIRREIQLILQKSCK